MKKFRLSDVVLSVICVVFVAEAAAPVAGLGNSQFFWWLFMIAAFLLPYGLISSELGTAYQGEGGLYDWVAAAYPGTRWGARVSWWYWLNFPLWMASLAVMSPDLIAIITGIPLGPLAGLAIQLVFIAVVTALACLPVCDSIFILNICAVIKVLLALLVGGMGLYFGMKNGFANPMNPASFLPRFDLDSLSYISVIIFNMLGFEVVCTFAADMKEPKKQIPEAIVIGGLTIAAIYLLGGFGIAAGIPVDQISPETGLLDAIGAMSGTKDGPFLSVIAALFLVTFFGNMLSWSVGVNSTAALAAHHGDMPKIFAKRGSNSNMPVGAALVNGVVAGTVCMVGTGMNHIVPGSELFWTFFALNLVLLLISYLPMFPAFLKLRRCDPNRKRPFRVPGGSGQLQVMAIVPMIIIVISVIFTAVPLSWDRQSLEMKLPITIGAFISIALGEVLAGLRHGKKTGRKRTNVS